MPHESDHTIYNSIIIDYRQALADEQFSHARARAEGKVKDQRIAELTHDLEAARAPSGPQGPSGHPAPKPGPPPAT